MLPAAYIVHQLCTRLRLRIPEMRQDAVFFESVQAELEKLPGITETRTNEITGSILLSHQFKEFHELETAINGLGLFELCEGPQPVKPAAESLVHGISTLDQTIRQASSGGVDLRTLAFTAMIGLTLHQAIRGNLMGPAIPTMASAMALFQQFNSDITDTSTDS